MREVTLHGFLGKQFTKSIMLDVGSVGEAIRALRANFPDFERAVVAYEPGYHVYIDDREVSEEELPMLSGGAIRIVPHIRGSGDSFVQIIIGAALIAVSFALPTSLAFLQPYLIGMGVSMALGGLVGLLTKPPTAEAPQEKDKPSYAFSGAVNTSLAGNPVPILYGRLLVGSQVVSADIRTEEIKVAS